MVRVAAVLLALALAGCTEGELSHVPPDIRAQVLPARQVFGSCLASPVSQKTRVTDAEYLKCGLTPKAGYRSRGKVVGATPRLIDTMGEPKFGRYCPEETDDGVLARLPSRETALLCLDSKPGIGNPGGLGEHAFDRVE